MYALVDQRFPFQVQQARFLTPMEQVLCMVWLAETYSMKELRERQALAKKQIQAAYKQKNDEALQDLQMIYDNLSAAVAYQTFRDDSWMMFIKTNN